MKRLMVSTSTELISVPPSAVVHVAADGNYSSIFMADGNNFVVTMQLGQIENLLASQLDGNENRFVRIGKSLIVNCDYVALINPVRQRMIMSDCRTFRYELSASKEALKALKEFLEKDSKK